MFQDLKSFYPELKYLEDDRHRLKALPPLLRMQLESQSLVGIVNNFKEEIELASPTMVELMTKSLFREHGSFKDMTWVMMHAFDNRLLLPIMRTNVVHTLRKKVELFPDFAFGYDDTQNPWVKPRTYPRHAGEIPVHRFPYNTKEFNASYTEAFWGLTPKDYSLLETLSSKVKGKSSKPVWPLFHPNEFNIFNKLYEEYLHKHKLLPESIGLHDLAVLMGGVSTVMSALENSYRRIYYSDVEYDRGQVKNDQSIIEHKRREPKYDDNDI
jgi:hypothetical protein